MGERVKILSERLGMLARMVTPGSRVADIGCDHGYLSIYLVQEGISPAVIAMDVRKGPLSAAREHIDARGLGTYIETRLSDGLEKLKPGEADTVVCAGMGGRLMERILRENMEKAQLFQELILQPQSELREFREFLRKSGFRIMSEDMVHEDGKYYFAMRAVPAGREAVTEPEPYRELPMDGLKDRAVSVRIYDKFGPRLLTERHPLLKQYLCQRERLLERLTKCLEEKDTERAGVRLQELREELGDVRRALELI